MNKQKWKENEQITDINLDIPLLVIVEGGGKLLIYDILFQPTPQNMYSPLLGLPTPNYRKDTNPPQENLGPKCSTPPVMHSALNVDFISFN